MLFRDVHLDTSASRLDPGTREALGELTPRLQQAYREGDGRQVTEILGSMRRLLPATAPDGPLPRLPPTTPGDIIGELESILRYYPDARSVGRVLHLFQQSLPGVVERRPYRELIEDVQTFLPGSSGKVVARVLDGLLVSLRQEVEQFQRVSLPPLSLRLLAPSNAGDLRDPRPGLSRIETDLRLQLRSQGILPNTAVDMVRRLAQSLASILGMGGTVVIPSLGELSRIRHHRSGTVSAFLNTKKLWNT